MKENATRGKTENEKSITVDPVSIEKDIPAVPESERLTQLADLFSSILTDITVSRATTLNEVRQSQKQNIMDSVDNTMREIVHDIRAADRDRDTMIHNCVVADQSLATLGQYSTTLLANAVGKGAYANEILDSRIAESIEGARRLAIEEEGRADTDFMRYRRQLTKSSFETAESSSKTASDLRKEFSERTAQLRSRADDRKRRVKHDCDLWVSQLASESAARRVSLENCRDESSEELAKLTKKHALGIKSLERLTKFAKSLEDQISQSKSELSGIRSDGNLSIKSNKRDLMNELSKLKTKVANEGRSHNDVLKRLARNYETTKCKLERELETLARIERIWAQCQKLESDTFGTSSLLVLARGEGEQDYLDVEEVVRRLLACSEIEGIAISIENDRIGAENEVLKKAAREYIRGISITESTPHILLKSIKLCN